MQLANEKFRRSRGGRSRFLALSCESCGAFLFNYQKDGPGILKRLYLDRINRKGKGVSSSAKLTCPKCKTLLGVSIVYKKEKRPAYRLFAGAVSKQLVKSPKK